MSLDIRHGDCREVMAAMPEASIDAVVTDPPYGLEFMGRAWDHGVPGVPFWTEALRVLKPGGHFLAFGGTRTYHRLTCAIEDAGFEVRDCLMWLYGSGFPKSRNIGGGWGTALKPAWEPIILARKPLIGTVAANVQEHGPGALNIDGCRIGIEPMRVTRSDGTIVSENRAMAAPNTGRVDMGEKIGRWPANLVLDEEAGAMLDEQSGERQSGDRQSGEYGRLGYHGFGVGPMPEIKGDSGGASRFFYTAKASTGERHYAGKNSHPTVKPVDLMRWLCRLVTPPGGLVLDPFCGSGSTGVAALAEGFRFIGIEKDAEYVEMARRRIAGPLFAEVAG
jgi:site-specific DNA-methyltransferase (adenine-specific)